LEFFWKLDWNSSGILRDSLKFMKFQENSGTKPAMAMALEAHQCGPSTDSKKRYFGAKSTRISEKVQILALKMAIFQKCGP
jgi:hypothetical protein